MASAFSKLPTFGSTARQAIANSLDLFKNASTEDLAEISNVFALIGWFFIFLGVLGLFMESIGQKRLFYEAFPPILFGLFCLIPFGMHANFTNFFSSVIPVLVPIP